MSVWLSPFLVVAEGRKEKTLALVSDVTLRNCELLRCEVTGSVSRLTTYPSSLVKPFDQLAKSVLLIANALDSCQRSLSLMDLGLNVLCLCSSLNDLDLKRRWES